MSHRTSWASSMQPMFPLGVLKPGRACSGPVVVVEGGAVVGALPDGCGTAGAPAAGWGDVEVVVVDTVAARLLPPELQAATTTRATAGSTDGARVPEDY